MSDAYTAAIMFLRSAFIFIAISLFSASAHAGMAGIGNATVEKDALMLHLRGSYSADDENAGLDERFRSRFMADYGFTDSFALGLYLQGDNRQGNHQELDAAILDARFELTDAASHGFYSGFRLRYTLKDGDKKPDNAHIRLIFGVPVGGWDFRLNQIFAQEIGQERRGGLGINTRLQATYAYHPQHRMGIESFSDFGYGSRQNSFDAQNHTAGPVFTGRLAQDLSYEAGYRYGLSEAAADHTVKLFLVHRF